ncbi:hypothetical protein H0H92_001518 [Tricholoma furcatifolium]|nr:hypothetical protein H0H92_001518 [Tricholoma furcatifolium]
MSEIDDIFSSKGKASAPQPIASTSSLPGKQEKSKNKKNKKRKRDDSIPDSDAPPPKPTPETVIDTSNSLAIPKKQKIEKKSKPLKSSKKDADVDTKFTDSRGSRPRWCFSPFVKQQKKDGPFTKKMSWVYAMMEVTPVVVQHVLALYHRPRLIRSLPVSREAMN